MKKLLLTTTLLGALMSSVQAVDLDGNALLRECSRDATRFCQGFALGIAWAGPQYCKPEGLMGSDHTAVVMRYLRQQSGRLHLPAQNLVAEAYAAAWPCKNQVVRTRSRPRPHRRPRRRPMTKLSKTRPSWTSWPPPVSQSRWPMCDAEATSPRTEGRGQHATRLDWSDDRRLLKKIQNVEMLGDQRRLSHVHERHR
jgi:Rap1a immunity proteins